MCHPEVPVGTVMPRLRTRELALRVSTGGEMPALLALPERTPAPGVLIINDVFGRGPFYEGLARRLALAGYAALCPEFFHRQGALAEQTREEATARRARLDLRLALADIGDALEVLRARDETRGRAVGTIGFCMGGTMVLQLAALRRDIAASVSYYGFPAAQSSDPKPPLELADRMRGPILGHWGSEDTGVGMANVEALRAKLEASGVEHAFHIYQGLGHGFLKAFLEDERATGYEQACTSWKRTLEFYGRQLR